MLSVYLNLFGKVKLLQQRPKKKLNIEIKWNKYESLTKI